MFALLEFLEGVDKGMRSIVPLKWIRNGQAYETGKKRKCHLFILRAFVLFYFYCFLFHNAS